MRKCFIGLAFTITAVISAGKVSYGYTNPINGYGITGHINIPSAYIQDKNSVSAGYGYIFDKKSYLFLSSHIIPGLEAGININTENGSDKNLNLKYQFLPETKRLPAVAFGINLKNDTRNESIYFAISKYNDSPIPNTITVGYGNGYLDGFFAGTELLLHPKFTITTEFYDKKFICGLRIMPLKGLNITPAYNFKSKSIEGIVSFTYRF